MADIIDVMNAFVASIAQTIYPNGTGQASVTGLATKVYPGWPQSSQLDADLAGFAKGGGAIHVTVYPTGTEKNVTRFSNGWQTLADAAPTITLTIAGQAVSLGGTVSVPQNVALLVGGLPYVYAVQLSDTLTSIATALASMISGATSSGPIITLPPSARIQAARSGSVGTSVREIRRQQRTMQLTIWADTPAHREATAQALDVALAATEYLLLPDGTGARIVYQSSRLDDATQKANLYRRDLLYIAEYATTQTMQATEVVMTQQNQHVGMTGASADLTVSTIYQ